MEQKRKFSTVDLVMTALCTAIIAVLSQISFPLPSGVPVTLQTFAVALCGYLLGWKYGLASVIVYILLGAVGVPVFAGFKGGLSAVVGVTAGFIWGFLPMVALCGIGVRKGISKNTMKAAFGIGMGLLGLVCCHAIGAIWYMVVTQNGLLSSLLLVSLPYIPKDIVSVVAGYVLAFAVRRALRAANVVAEA